MILAGDIGGTKTLLGVFDAGHTRPRPLAVRSFGTLDYDDLPAMIADFLRTAAIEGRRIASACFGVAGPIIDQAATLTNVPWRVDARHVARTFSLARVHLLNDLEAMGYAVPVLEPSELHVLQAGDARPDGNMAIIAAGTGLGEALVHRVGGRLVPLASEGGHADFAARTEDEIRVLRALTSRFGRVDVEHVVSGHGLTNIHPVLHERSCDGDFDLAQPDAPALITAAAIEGRCRGCADTLDLFVGAYGAEAGNLALRGVATGGVFVGGGIAPKILPALTNGAFVRAFGSKPPLGEMLARMPVKVILNPEAGVIGAAVFAASASATNS
jgi:glucokinase